MMYAALALAVAATPASPRRKPHFDEVPHTLVIADRKGITRIEYKNRMACMRAREDIRQQTIPPRSRYRTYEYRVRVMAFCVPRE